MNDRKTLIAGASGLVGSFLLKKLLEDDYYKEVYILTRRPLPLKHDKARQIVTDFELLGNAVEEIRVDDVYCCLGTTINKAGSRESFKKVDYHYPLKLARVMRNNGAEKYFMVTSMGADKRSVFFYNRVKGEVENALKQLQYPLLMIFRPSLLLGERDEKRTGEDVAKKVYKYLDKIFVGPLKKYKGIHADTVATAMINLAKKGLKGTHTIESDKIMEAGKAFYESS